MSEPYGIILPGVTMRDLGGITMEHIGTKGQSISKAVIGEIYTRVLLIS